MWGRCRWRIISKIIKFIKFYEKKTIFNKYEIIFNKRKVRNSDLVSTVNFGALTREAAEGADLTKEEYGRVRQLVDQLKNEKKLKSDEHRQTNG